MKKKKNPLLVVEDDPGLRSQLRWCFDDFEVLLAADRTEALTLLRRRHPGVVTLDLGLPPDPGGVSEGMAALKEILAVAPETKIIVVTGNDERDHAVQAIGLGAYDFYLKPVDPKALELVVARAQKVFELEVENRRLRATSPPSPLRGIVTDSPEMLAACATIEKVAPTDASVLILGESGTGKELFARAVHELSERRTGRLVAINCAAIPEGLLESELFGYEKGAFSGAGKQTPGKIECADGGTLFLDEIGDLPLGLQAKLLRFLQERVIERVGGREEIPVDIRVVCATHHDLERQVADGRFRLDLFYRIADVIIRLPPLRERSGDVTLLAHAFLDKYNRELGKRVRGFTPEALNALAAYHWPGNVRELENRVKSALILTEGRYIECAALNLAAHKDHESPLLNLQAVRERAEANAIRQALAQAAGNVSQAAKLLGVTRPTLYHLMERYHIKNESLP